MTNYREILRLDSIGLNKTEIATSCGCSRNTVSGALKRAEECGLSWPLPADMSDQQLARILYPSITGKPEYKMPDYEYVYREMQRKGVTLNLLWLEYVERCRQSGDVPYQSTQFNKYYGEYVAKHSATMHLNHKPGEIMQVDWAGDAAEVIDNITGEILDVYVFVAVLPYSGYGYVEGFFSMNQEFATASSMIPTALSWKARNPCASARASRKTIKAPSAHRALPGSGVYRFVFSRKADALTRKRKATQCAAFPPNLATALMSLPSVALSSAASKSIFMVTPCSPFVNIQRRGRAAQSRR